MIIGISGKLNSGKDTVAQIINFLSIGGFDLYNSFRDFYEFYTDGIDEYPFKTVKFADKLKDCACLILGCTREQIENREFKEKELGKEWWYYKGRNGSLIPFNDDSKRNSEDLIKLTPRLLLQLLGTDCGRNIIHPNIWVNATMAKYTLAPDPNLTITEWKDKKSFSQKEALEYIYPSGHKYPKWIISDVRFPNEAKAIKDRNGILIRVNRFCYDSLEDFLVCHPDEKVSKEAVKIVGNHEGDYSGLTTKLLAIPESSLYFSKHESEVALDNYNDWDYVIDNNGTIEDLIEKVKQILIKEKIIWNTY